MRALVCPEIGDEDILRVEDVPAPECGPGDVRIGVHAAAASFPDVLVIRGQYQNPQDPPFIPGNECAGVVLEVGADVDAFAVGDRVMALPGVGAFAEEVVCRATGSALARLHRIPDAMPYDEAAGLVMNYGTGLHAWQRAQLQPGERVLVLGAAGGCGSAAIQIAKAMGAWVIGAASSPEKLALAERCGADAVVDYQTESLSERVKELTDGHGVDVLFDPVGGADFREYLRTLAWNGRYLVVGFAGGEIPKLGLNLVLLKSVSLIGVAYGASVARDPALNGVLFDQLFDWYAEGKVGTVIGQRFPLADAADALRVLHDRGALGKVVVDVLA
ncbi:MAG: NADPH:quinone oxidoreductase family protein [Acidimicrobiia bacterium]